MQINIARKYHDKVHELRTLFEKQLKEVYWAEKNILGYFPAILENIFSNDLKKIIEQHIIETHRHIKRLNEIFSAIGIKAEEEKIDSVVCLVNECENVIKFTKKGVVRDAAIIALLQKIKLFEIACYGTLRAFAIALREEDVVILLQENLMEEKQTDLHLSEIAESHINIEAADKEI